MISMISLVPRAGRGQTKLGASVIASRLASGRVALVGALIVVLAIASSAMASTRVVHHRWPIPYRVIHRSNSSIERRSVWPSRRSRRARASIVGGSQIAITQAPWQVVVLAFIPKPENKLLVLLCGGSIVDESRIVTAGHCVFDPTTGLRTPSEDLLVVAGTDDFERQEVGEQVTLAASVRVHPDYDYALGAGASDDVTVLTLAKSLSFNPLVQPIGLVNTAAAPSEGTHVNLTGFGLQDPSSEANGFLYSLGMTVGFSRQCGGQADAVFLCASASGGSGCLGDSGSGLTDGPTPSLVGVMDTVEVISGEPCRAGSDNGFVNTAAPEIRDFIEGSEAPPQAPRGGGAAVRGVTRVGEVVTCEPGSWTGSPTLVYSFVDSSSKQTLQSGSSAVYQLTTADVGRTIYCQVSATNAGGTGVGRTPPLSAVEALAPPPTKTPVESGQPAPEGSTGSSPKQMLPSPSFPSTLSLAGTSLTTRRDGSVIIKLECEGEELCSGELKLQAEQTFKTKRGKRRVHFVAIGHVGFSVSPERTTDVTLRLSGLGLDMLRAAHGRLSARLQLAQASAGTTETVAVRLIASALRGSATHKK